MIPGCLDYDPLNGDCLKCDVKKSLSDKSSG